jgi:hypothetical protein
MLDSGRPRRGRRDKRAGDITFRRIHSRYRPAPSFPSLREAFALGRDYAGAIVTLFCENALDALIRERGDDEDGRGGRKTQGISLRNFRGQQNNDVPFPPSANPVRQPEDSPR